jgi:hypothetical protein
MSCCAIANSTDFSSAFKLALRKRERLHLVLAYADCADNPRPAAFAG